MYADRLKTLTRAYSAARRNNQLFTSASEDLSLQESRVLFLSGLQEQIKTLDLAMTSCENSWRQGVLSVLENEISDNLAYVYPADGYTVDLTSKVSRGKIHIEARVRSTFSNDFPGKIKGTQGRLFQQVVSFSALLSVMHLLGVSTVYIDEAFSGTSKKNVRKLNGLLCHLKERGFNIVMIAQDTTIADGVGANRLLLSRSIDNKTVVQQEGEVSDG